MQYNMPYMTEYISLDLTIRDARNSTEYTSDLEKAALNRNSIFHRYDSILGVATQQENEVRFCEYNASQIMDYGVICINKAISSQPSSLEEEKRTINLQSIYYKQALEAFIAVEIISTYNDEFLEAQDTRFNR